MTSVKILSYNVLAQVLVKRAWYPYASKPSLKQALRIPKVLDLIIKTHKPDIACLQEVDLFDQFYQKRLNSAGYDYVYLKKDDRAHSHGLCICWKREKLNYLYRVRNLITDELA